MEATDSQIVVPRCIKRKIFRAAQNGMVLSINDCLPPPKEPSPLERTYKLLNDYFQVIRITNMIESSNGRCNIEEGQKRVIEYCNKELLFAKYNIQCGQKKLAKWRLTNITEKLAECNMVNLKLLGNLRSIKVDNN